MKALILLAAACAATLPAAAATLREDGRATWQGADETFGGLSDLAIAPDGGSLVAIGDRGIWVRGDLSRDGEGRLTGVALRATGPLLGVKGRALAGEEADAEDLAIDRRGHVYIAFEGYHRIRRYADIAGPAAPVAAPEAFVRLQRNSGIEALAMDGAGRLHAIPERSGKLDRPFPVYRLADGKWSQPFGIPRRGAFLVSGADFGPDGKLYVVERDFRWLGGFATRVRRFSVGDRTIADEETLLETAFGEIDNMEGISVWQDAAGGIRVTLLSDDNFFPIQRTEIVEYRLVDN